MTPVLTENDVRGAWIRTGIVELIAQGLARKYFLNAKRLLVGGHGERCNDARGERRVREPDEEPSSEMSNASAVPMVAAG